MTEPSVTMPAGNAVSGAPRTAVRPRETAGALFVGALAGAAAFLLCALLLAPMGGIVIATVAALAAFVRRARPGAIAFVAAGALAAVALVTPSTRVLLAAAAAFGIGLAIVARIATRAGDDVRSG